MKFTQPKVMKKRSIIFGLIGGLLVGFVNGFFGGGGGMIVVPLLIFLFGQSDKKAHATAIFIILPLCVISSIIYIINGNIDLIKLLYASIGFTIGGVVGSLLLKKANNNVLRIIFSIIMVAAGIRIIV